MSSISKNLYIDKLYDIVNKYNNAYHSKIKTKPVGVNSSTHINFGVESNDKDPKYEVGVQVIISKYKNIFAKYYTPNWFEEIFVIIKNKTLMEKKSFKRFMKKNCKRQINNSYKKMGMNYMLIGKTMMIHSIAGLIKKT